MRIIKIKVPSQDLFNLGFPNYFTTIDRIEIIQIYQYDRNNFFAMHKIHFKTKIDSKIESYISDLFSAQSVQILEKNQNEILCIIKQRNSSGFWPILLSGNWALLPPIEIDAHAAIFSIIAKEDEEFNLIFKQLKMFKTLEFLSMSKPDGLTENLAHSSPNLTTRQREITSYAHLHGYFESPKKISTKQLAEHFGIGLSAINNHIQKAELRIMNYHFGK